MRPGRSLCAALACLWEATARKAGNVHPRRDFAELAYRDLVLSAGAIAHAMERAPLQPVGVTILQAVEATRALVATNSNLGIVLLLAPLAAVPDHLSPREGIAGVLEGLSVADAEAAFDAIRLAVPGG